MSYRGGDLELRTPQGLPASKRSPVRDPEPAVNRWHTLSHEHSPHRPIQEDRSEPIWVDDIVMDCCNQAFELASAHRADEVRLDHLLHALTVVEGALTLLEQKGIRTTQLRRETGARIISDVPLAAGAPPPRRSAELQKSLSKASEWAYARRRPVSVIDLISVLLQAPRDWPGIDLVHQFADEWATREATQRERVRVAALSQYTSDTPSAQTPSDYPTPPWAGQSHDKPLPLAPLAQDAPQASAELLDAVAQIGERLQAVEGVERRLADFGEILTGLVERLSKIEHGLNDEMEEHHDGLAVITTRLGALEETLGGIQPERAIGAIETRLADIQKQGVETRLLIAAADETLKAIDARASGERQGVATQQMVQDLKSELSGLSGALERRSIEIISAVSQTVRDSLPVIEPQPAPVLEIPEVRDIPHIVATLAQTETMLGSLDGRITTASQTVTHELGQLGLSLNRELGQFHDNLIKLNVNQKTIAEGMDQWRLDTNADLGTLNERLAEMERTSEKMMLAQETLLASIQAIHRHTARWQDRRQKLQHALFGDGRRGRWFPKRQSTPPAAAGTAAGSGSVPAKLTLQSRVQASRERAAAWVSERMTRARDYARFRPRKA